MSILNSKLKSSCNVTIDRKNHQWNPDSQLGNIKTGGESWKPMKANNFSAPVSAAPLVSPMSVQPQTGMWGAAPTMSAPAANWNNNPFMTQPQGMMQPQGMVSYLIFNFLNSYNSIKIKAQPRAQQPIIRPATTISSSNPFNF